MIRHIKTYFAKGAREKEEKAKKRENKERRKEREKEREI